MGAAGIILVIIIIIAIFVALGWLSFGFNVAKGQTVAPPIALPPTPPAVAPPVPTLPTPVPTPTPTLPSPNLQYLPQKSYVQTFAPEVGVPSSVPLQAVPQVVPVQAQQSGVFDTGSIMSILALITAGGSGFLSKLGLDKAKNAQQTGQAVAENNVQQATVQQKTLEQVYENMPDKGASINNKPEIKLEAVAKVKEEALKVASKA